MKKNKGITLIALIITIIVMLILVAVSVNVLIKSNLIGTAEKTVDKYKTASEEEANGGIIEINGKKYASIDDYQAKKEYIDSNIPGGTRVTKPTEYKEGNKIAIIPAGFTVSGIDNERTIDGGLVIYLIPEEELKDVKWDGTEKTKYDQFVWIPITHEQINEMFICQGKTKDNGNCNITVENEIAKCINQAHQTIPVEATTTTEAIPNKATQMAGRLYLKDSGENYKKDFTEVYTPNSGRREPDIVKFYDGWTNTTGNEYVWLSILTSILGDGYNTPENFKNTLQTEYNEIVALIYNAGGYYVGRYETSNITQKKGKAINVVAGTNSGISGINWYFMYAQQKTYVTNKSLGNKIRSSMILGTCYDQMLEFVNVEGKYDVTKSGNVGHTYSKFTTVPYLTGGIGYNENYSGFEAEPYKDFSKNIYDLEGNVQEWTTEANDTQWRNYRGRQLRKELFC